MTLLLSHWIFLGGVLALWFAAQAGRRNKAPYPASRRYGITLLFALAWLQLSYWLRINGLAAAWPGVFYLHQPLLYAVGPLFYFYTESLQGQAPDDSRALRHLAPALMIAVLSLAQWLWHSPAADLTLASWLYCLSFGTGAAYAWRVMLTLRSFAHPASLILAELTLLRITVAFGMGVVMLALMGSLLQQEWFFPLHASAISALMLMTFVIDQRYPELGQKVEEEIAAEAEQRSKPRSPLTAIDVQDTLTRLRHAMDIEQRYADEELDLPSLAALLNVSTHQLSQLINEHLGMNYTRFVKSYRVAAAKRLLLEQPEETVLNIALQAGFNSLSSFHAAFKELEGVTPGMYRKQIAPPAQNR